MYILFMSCEFKDGPSLLKSPFKMLKEFFAVPGVNPAFIDILPKALVLGLGSGVALSVIFGLERRRYL